MTENVKSKMTVATSIIIFLLGIFTTIYGFTYTRVGEVERQGNINSSDIKVLQAVQQRYTEDITEIKTILKEMAVEIRKLP